MKTPAINPTSDASPEALQRFLRECAGVAAAAGRPQLVSISMEVETLDPLAVLESIFEPGEPHFYAERPAQGFSVAGAEPAITAEFAGPERWVQARAWIGQVLDNTIAVGPLSEPFAGPHFFCAAAFSAETNPTEPFPALRLLVPRWQVGRTPDATMAVANVLLSADAPVDFIAAKIWKARQKFGAFDYSQARRQDRPSAPRMTEEVGGAGSYQRAVAEALGSIGRGELEKVVLARALRFETDEAFHPMGVLNHLRSRFPDCYAFSVGNGRGQSFIGASPERLVRVADGKMQTTALAGSAARGATASEDAALGRELLHSEKDLREHRLVAEAIVGRLRDLPLRLEFPAQPRLLALANVQHLHTPISAVFPPTVHILDVVARLHPTPAVGGAPHAAALTAIGKLEAFPRGLYAGALGWVDHRGGGEFFVGIRSALIEGNKATAYAGAGIVAGSDPQKEFAETELKFRALLGALTEG